jgi:hypothetical protein
MYIPKVFLAENEPVRAMLFAWHDNFRAKKTFRVYAVW